MPTPAPVALHHAGYLVHDLEATARKLSASLALGPWRVWTVPVARGKVRGRDQAFRFRVALALPHDGGLGASFELVQPVEGPSVYEEFLAARGPGFHHACVTYDSIEALRAAKAALLAEGRVPIQEAFGGDSFEFAYFDFPELGSAVEILFLAPGSLGDPEAVW